MGQVAVYGGIEGTLVGTGLTAGNYLFEDCHRAGHLLYWVAEIILVIWSQNPIKRYLTGKRKKLMKKGVG
jgi:hypothetical protein